MIRKDKQDGLRGMALSSVFCWLEKAHIWPIRELSRGREGRRFGCARRMCTYASCLFSTPCAHTEIGLLFEQHAPKKDTYRVWVVVGLGQDTVDSPRSLLSIIRSDPGMVDTFLGVDVDSFFHACSHITGA